MKLFMIIFSVLSGIFAIGSLAYVAAEMIQEVKRKRDNPKKVENPEPAPIAKPVAAPPPEPPVEVMPPPVESVSAEEADEMISDDLALSGIIYEDCAEYGGKRTYVNIGAINEAFDADQVVDIDALKKKGLVPRDIRRIKVLADGVLSKPLTVKANSYSVQAIKMIELTGGTVVVRRAAQNQ